MRAQVTSTRQTGLTLLELVVSLLVLTILTSVAIRSVSGIQEQARLERTKRLLEEFRRATLGDSDWSSGVFGYAFDLATLPDNLRHLLVQTIAPAWDPALAAVSYRPSSGASLETRALGYGWRGPYLAITTSPDDPDAVRDGFGGAEGTFANVTNYGWSYTFDSVSLVVKSLGADHQEGPPGFCGQDVDYEEDCLLKIKREDYRFTPTSVTVTLTPPSGGGTQNVFLAIFTRDFASPNHLAAAFSNNSNPVVEDGNPQSLAFTFPTPNPKYIAGPVYIGLFRCAGYSPCPPANLSSFLSGQRIIYPDNRELLYWQVRPKSNSFVISW